MIGLLGRQCIISLGLVDRETTQTTLCAHVDFAWAGRLHVTRLATNFFEVPHCCSLKHYISSMRMVG